MSVDGAVDRFGRTYLSPLPVVDSLAEQNGQIRRWNREDENRRIDDRIAKAGSRLAEVHIGVLGRLEVLRDGSAIDLGPRKQRAVLAALALHWGEVVSLDRVVDLLWGGEPPAAAAASIHGYVAALRRVLDPDRAARSAGTVLLSAPPGYRLHLPELALDAARFAAGANSVHRLARRARVGGADHDLGACRPRIPSRT